MNVRELTNLIRQATFTGTAAELRERLVAMREAGYRQFAVQLVHGHEAAINDWANFIGTI